jgi:hypothetical protein
MELKLTLNSIRFRNVFFRTQTQVCNTVCCAKSRIQTARTFTGTRTLSSFQFESVSISDWAILKSILSQKRRRWS